VEVGGQCGYCQKAFAGKRWLRISIQDFSMSGSEV
jgi:hypothetical protein